jgi:hypothetical protein
MLLVRLEGEPIACNLLSVSDDRFVQESLLSVSRYLEISLSPTGPAPGPGAARRRAPRRQTRSESTCARVINPGYEPPKRRKANASDLYRGMVRGDR